MINWKQILRKVKKDKRSLSRDSREVLAEADVWLNSFVSRLNEGYYDGFLNNYYASFGNLGDGFHGCFVSGYKTHNIIVNYNCSLLYAVRSTMHEVAHLADYLMGIASIHGKSFLEQLETMGIGVSRFSDTNEGYMLVCGKFYRVKLVGYSLRKSVIFHEFPKVKDMVYLESISNAFTAEEIIKFKKPIDADLDWINLLDRVMDIFRLFEVF